MKQLSPEELRQTVYQGNFAGISVFLVDRGVLHHLSALGVKLFLDLLRVPLHCQVTLLQELLHWELVRADNAAEALFYPQARRA